MAIKNNFRHTIYACYVAYSTQALIVNFPPLLFLIFNEQYGIPLTKITWLITLNFIVQLTMDFLSSKFVDKIGYRTCMLAAHAFCAVGLIGMAFLPTILPPFTGLLISVVIYAMGGGVIEVLTSPIVEASPADNKAAAMSLLHSFYCWGMVAVIVLSTVFFAIFGKENWQVLCCIWALLPLFNIFYFTQVPINTLTAEGEGMTVGQLAKSGLFWLFVLLMISSGAAEQAMAQWASAFAESGLKVSKTVGDLAGPCLFSVMMGIVRAFYGKYSEKVNLLSFIIASAVLCVLSFLITSFSPWPVVSLIGCALCGISVGILWPGVLSVASASFPKGGTAMFALLALSGDIGCTSGPSLVGAVMGATGADLKTSLLAGILFPVILIVCSIIFKLKYKKMNVQ